MVQWGARVASALLAALAATPGMADVTLIVSPAGSDGWSGRRATRAGAAGGPFATLERARDELRAMRERGERIGRATILLRGGTYRIGRPIRWEPRDSGEEGAPVTVAAYPGERPVLSGGKPIRGWRPAGHGVWRAVVPEARGGRWPFRELWMDGRRLTLARSPNSGAWTMAGKAAPGRDPATGAPVDRGNWAFRYRPGTVRPWPNLREANAVVYHIWETSILPLASVDPESRTIAFAGPAKWAFGWCGEQRFFIENHAGALDAPGEWQLDRATGVLSLIPPKGKDPRRAEIVAPLATSLLEIAGEPERDAWVRHVRFRGISFQHAGWRLPPEGHGDWQAAVTVPAAVTAVGAVRCSFEACEIARVGGYGLALEAGCAGNLVRQCHFHDLGAGGVKIGRTEPATGALATGGNTVDNCWVHDGGRTHPGAIGIWVGQSSDNTISHNEICDMNYTGISVGWSWGFAPTTCHRNQIEFNHLHHLGQRTMSDMGAIYTLGISTGTVIRNNLIHEIWGHETFGSGGIYPDEGTSGVLIENNLVYGTLYAGFSIHYGRDIVARNNIFALSRDRQISRGRADQKTTFTFERNIVAYDRGVLMTGDGAIVASGNNVYWHAGGKPVVFPDGLTLAEWQARGYDRGSVVADPRFVDLKRQDFRLRPDSPALRLGFQPFDTRHCGLYGPKAWTQAPRAIRRPPFAFPAPLPRKPLLLNETFEDEPPGVTAPKAVTYGENAAGTVRVTDETAAAGRHSLKFSDAVGMDFPFNPHLWYVPNLDEGLATLVFDLRVEPGAIAVVEWRDAGAPYRTGPSLTVDAGGNLTAAGRPAGRVPHGAWVRYEVTCGLGKQASGRWSLRATGPGVDVRLDDLPCDPRFRRLEWLGFVANATERAVFYLDNVRLRVAAVR